MSAETVMDSPTTALAGHSPVGVRGRTLSITTRPSTLVCLPRSAYRRNVMGVHGGRGPGGYLRGDAGTSDLHRAGPPPRSAGAFGGAGHEPAVGVGRTHP